MPDEPRIPADLIRRLPATFGPALNDQLAHSEFLFPAERRQLRSRVEVAGSSCRGRSSTGSSLRCSISKAAWTCRTGNRDAAGMSVREVGILARSPLYPQWRTEVEQSL